MCNTATDPGTWTANPVSPTTVTLSKTGDSDTIPGHTDTTCNEVSLTGKSKSSSGYAQWSGTWETLGVPAGATVSGVQMSYDWRCSAFTTGGTGNILLKSELDLGGATSGFFFSSNLSITGTTSYATRTGQNLTGPAITTPSSVSVAIRQDASLVTGSSNSAVVTVHFTYMSVTVTYTVPFMEPTVVYVVGQAVKRGSYY